MKKGLKNLLNQLNLIENEAVFFRNKEAGKTFDAFSSDIKKNLNNIQPDAFFVFNKQPLILFFDLSELDDSKKEIEIHKKVWSFDISPVIFVIKNTEIKVYNALNYIKKEKSLEELKFTEEERTRKFSFWNLQSGETLEWFYEKNKKNILKKRVHQQLFENIKQTILLLKGQYNLEEKESKILVLRLIFTRYLIDRKIKIDNTYIYGEAEEIIVRRKSLSNLIANPKRLVGFFNYLDTRFNGVLFKNSNLEITAAQANLLSKLFNPDGVTIEEKINLFSDFDFQFEVFDFGIIPVELISGIYETLLDEETKNSTSAVYTPPFLVDYILTQTIDQYFEENKQASECKIFDPAMGSGIFLVQGLRRMIEQEKKLNPNNDNVTFGNKIKEIAERNLFGIDINEEAINVACFSIYIALLDYQEPANIDVYKFPYLDKNFYKTNFFSRKVNKDDQEETKLELELFNKNLNRIKSEKIDFIVGNPPWKRDNKDYHIGWLNENNIYPKNEKGEKEIALSYLMRVNDFMGENTICSLIVTSTIFYNVADTTRFVKNKFYQNYSIHSVLDLSPVRKLVFEGKKSVPKKDRNKNIQYDKNGNIIYESKPIISPAVVIQFQKYDQHFSEQNPVKFTSIKTNKFFNKFTKALVIEKFDQKEILQKHFVENDWMFKVALYGNTLDFVLLKRLEENKNKVLDYKDKYYTKGQGVIKSSNSTKTEPKLYPEYIGYKLIENSEINKIYTNISNQKTLKEEDVNFIRGRKNELFDGIKIIIKEQVKDETFILSSIIDVDCLYVNGVSALNFNNENDAKIIFALFNSNLFTYYLFSISCAWGLATRPAIRLDDEYLSFPYIEPNELQKKQLIKLVDQLLQPYKDFYVENPNMAFQGEPNSVILENINKIIEEIYEIKPYEKDLINYVLEVSRYQFQESKQDRVTSFTKFGRNKNQILKDYAEVYLQEFVQIYDDCFFKVEVYELDAFIAMQFIVYDEKPENFKPFEIVKEVNDEKKLFQKLSNLSISQIASSTDNEHNLFIQKDIKGFDESSFYIIKPKEYKSWHRAMAWYDVAEFKEAIQRAELARFNQNEIDG
jgi:hypothetical protein